MGKKRDIEKCWFLFFMGLFALGMVPLVIIIWLILIEYLVK